MVTVHCFAAASVAPPAVNVSAALAVPELLAVTVKFVLPHPLVVGADMDAMEKAGSATIIWSAATIGTLSANASTSDVAASVTGFIMRT